MYFQMPRAKARKLNTTPYARKKTSSPEEAPPHELNLPSLAAIQNELTSNVTMALKGVVEQTVQEQLAALLAKTNGPLGDFPLVPNQQSGNANDTPPDFVSGVATIGADSRPVGDSRSRNIPRIDGESLSALPREQTGTTPNGTDHLVISATTAGSGFSVPGLKPGAAGPSLVDMSGGAGAAVPGLKPGAAASPWVDISGAPGPSTSFPLDTRN